MATVRDIRRRIRSVESTQKITRAMKLVAAAKLRRAQERVFAARPYAGKMAELLGNLVGGADTGDEAPHPPLSPRAGPPPPPLSPAPPPASPRGIGRSCSRAGRWTGTERHSF